MPAFIYKRPNTGFSVQGWLLEMVPADEGRTYETLECVACGRMPPTNNGSEEGLRRCVIFRKVTNCFRCQWGANLYADIRSTIETARRRAIGALEAIRLTLNGTPLPVPATHLSG
jgi:hypothetical protein